MFPTCTDNDGDGFGSPGNPNCTNGADEDCNDLDASVWPGGSELCDGKDNDCDGTVPVEEQDADEDSARGCENDCDDEDPAIGPQAVELPGNAVDENCDGSLGACDPLVAWRNHGQFVRCVSQECDDLVDEGLVSEETCDGLVSQAARSDVGRD